MQQAEENSTQKIATSATTSHDAPVRAMKTSCVPCRTRKVKCDGKQPQCTNCARYRRPLDCTYVLPKRVHTMLYKGEACAPCRRRKRKCDAVRPSCGNCQHFNQEGECTYRQLLTHHQRFQRDSEGKVYELEPAPKTTNTHKFISMDPSSFAPNSVSSNPSTPVTPSPVPHIDSIIENFPLLSLGTGSGPYSSALSGVSLDDLNMRFRTYFLSRRLSFGIYFPPNKQRAIMTGDMSNTIIHPFYIHYAHLVGCQVHQELQGSYSLLTIQANHLRLTLEALGSMREQDDAFSFARANLFLGIAHGYTQGFRKAGRYHRIAMDVVRRNNIRFVATSRGDTVTPSMEPLEEVHERSGILAYMIYIANYIYLVGKPDFDVKFHHDEEFKNSWLPRWYSDIFWTEEGDPAKREISLVLENEFRDELPIAYPILFQICPIMLRTRSMILVKDASNLVRWFKQENPSPPVLWYTTCRIYIEHLLAHIEDVGNRLKDETQSAENLVSLQYSNIVSLTTLAQIGHVLAQGLPNAPAPREQRNDALRRVLRLVDELSPQDFKALDPFISIYWDHALDLFSQEMPLSTTNVSEGEFDVVTFWPEIPTPILEHEFDFEVNIERLAMLNDSFVSSHWLPGTTELCTALATENRRRDSTRTHASGVI